MILTSVVLAHVSDGDHTLQCVHFPGIYHTQYQAPSTRSRGVGEMRLCAVYECLGRHSSALFGDGTGVEGAWGIQIGAWDRHWGGGCRRI